MKRFLLGALCATMLAFPLGIVAAPPKATNVVTPMTQDLDAGQHNIGNANSVATVNADVTNELHAHQAFLGTTLLGEENIPNYPGSLDLANGSGDGHYVAVTAGVDPPTGRGEPGLYLQQSSVGSVAVWAKTGPAASDWTCLAGCS